MSTADEKIQHIPSRGGLGLVELGVTTLGAADGDEFFILHVKNFGEIAAGGLKLVAYILGIAAFWANILLLFHDKVPPCYKFVQQLLLVWIASV